MADFEVVGDVLVVPDGTRVSLAVGMDQLDVWLEVPVSAGFRETHALIRDRVMPEAAREYVAALEVTDAVAAIEVVRRWSVALNERLGKCLDLLPSGETTGQPSLPTSGSDSDSEQTERESTSPRRSRSRTRKPS